MVAARYGDAPVPDASDAPVPPFLAACAGRPAERVPVWFMRQAGRSLPEYRAIRAEHTFAQLIATPELAAEITLQPVRRLGVDAAILFSDLMTPVQAVTDGIEIETGSGPVVDQPFRRPADLGRLRRLEADVDLAPVLETIRMVRAELAADIALIGFAGAPFTVASYLVEGGRSRDFVHTKALMYRDPVTWRALLDQLADIAVATLRAQVAAGAQAVQLFDSWVGALDADDYRRHVLPTTTRVFAELADLGVPTIHFGVGASHLFEDMATAGSTVMGVDWRLSLDRARTLLGADRPVQGNLDPTVLFAPSDVVETKVRQVLASNGGRPGHVFNLGWGVLPETDPDALRRVVDLVHAEGTSTSR